MDKEQVIKFAKETLASSKQGQEIEHPKFDCKLSWYDCKSSEGIHEFIKDTTAIANTLGGDGYILIGFDDKRKIFEDADFRKSGLKDTSEINGLVSKYVSTSFTINYYEVEIDGHKIGILHIPPSFDKPYVIRNHVTKKEVQFPHKIFVRKGTQVDTATRFDLDSMYYERGFLKIKPGFDISVEVLNYRLLAGRSDYAFEVCLLIENKGSEPFAIISAEARYKGFNDEFGRASEAYFLNGQQIQSNSLIFQTGKIEELKIGFPFSRGITNFNTFYGIDLFEIRIHLKFNQNRFKEYNIITITENKMFKEELMKNKAAKYWVSP